MKYLLRSLFTFLALYGLVAVVADVAYFKHGLSISLAVQIATAIILLQYLIAPVMIRLLMDIDWNAQLPARNLAFLRGLCEKEGLPMPALGIIRGPAPNAFTFGRLQSDASIVVTSGLLESLTEEEVNAVLAHEAGHIKHWDFLAITIAAIAPLLLYQLYALVRNYRDDRWSAWLAYAAYWVSEFIVLSLSRTREYWADDFAAKAIGDPGYLSSGLVKICYGMAQVQMKGEWAKDHGTDQEKAEARKQCFMAGKIGVMGISTGQAAFALSGPSPQEAASLMRWDLENPWARIYELRSTHPLTALRVKAMNDLSVQAGKPARFPLPKSTGIQWGRFPLELVLCGAPWVLGLATIALRPLVYYKAGMSEAPALPGYVPALLAFATLGAILDRILYRYHGEFERATVLSLKQDVMPSEIRPRAVILEGTIAGRAEPGRFWSPDLLIKDDTGMMFVLDRQSIPLARVFVAQGVDAWIGKKVKLEGWYRRGLMPYVELSRLTSESGEVLHRSYSFWIQLAGAVVGTGVVYWFVG